MKNADKVKQIFGRICNKSNVLAAWIVKQTVTGNNLIHYTFVIFAWKMTQLAVMTVTAERVHFCLE